MICEIISDGIVFAADRYSTVPRQQIQVETTTVVQGQAETSKIVRWPYRRALAGAVGLGKIGEREMNEWLFNIVGDHAHFNSSKVVAEDIRDRLQQELTWDNEPEAVIVEFATYGERDGHTVPEFWHITNVPGVDPKNGYLPATHSFTAEEQILGKHLSDVAAADLKDRLAKCASQHKPFWFH